MDYRQKTLKELQEKRGGHAAKRVVVGLDGFVDTIVHLVARRSGQGDQFERMETIEAFGKRILAAAGRSTNIEMYPQVQKLGGNGPIMANALLCAGFPVRYLGALGNPKIHPVFDEFAKKTNAVSLTEPGHTTAIEFADGKIMLGITKPLEELTYDALIDQMGEGAFFDEMNRASLVCLVNWTMIPNMSAVYDALVERVLPNLPPLDGGRTFFFDLADPEKRSQSELTGALRSIARFQNFGNAILGLNFKEAQQAAAALGIKEGEDEPESLKRLAKALRADLRIKAVLIHPTKRAACATKDGEWCAEGPYVPAPRITTGAGDHFNAGFCAGQLAGLSPEASLTLGVGFSGYYVRSAKSPSLNDIDTFLRNW